jgi:glycosyltransferase involved in cell wall biosynthesis
LNLVAVNWRDIRDPDAGGAEIHLYEILRRVVKNGHRVTWFSCKFKGASDFDAYDGIDVVRKGNWYDANFVIPRAVKAFLRREDADLVIEDINKIPFYLPLHVDVPVMPVIPHLFGSTVFRETNPLFGAYVYAWELFIPWVYRRCRFAAISPSTKDDLVRRGIPKENVDVVLCGLDHDRFRILDGVSRYEAPTIVHFGRVRKYKAVDVVIRAFVKILGKLPGARLVIIGDGPELPNLKKLADTLGVGEAVEFTGRVGTERMVEILNRSHLFMNASPKEGWGLTVVEANACGVPVVGSDRPGLRDSILNDKTGYLVEYGDADAFAAKGLELLTDPALWQRMSTTGLEWARSMTWDRTAGEMEQLFLRECKTRSKNE